MTDAIKKVRILQEELAELIDRKERPRAWKQYQLWCDSIVETLRTQEGWIESFANCLRKVKQTEPAHP